MHAFGIGNAEFDGPNVFAKASRGHKQPKPHTHWRHREPHFEQETPKEALIANTRVLLRGVTCALNLVREHLEPTESRRDEVALPAGLIATQAALPHQANHKETAA